MLCDNNTKYLLNALPYLGKQATITKKPIVEVFVEKLVAGTFSGSQGNRTMDNWFMSIPLSLRPLEEFHLTTLGTIKKNKRDLPLEFKDRNTKIVVSGAACFVSQRSYCSVKPKPNKIVTLV